MDLNILSLVPSGYLQNIPAYPLHALLCGQNLCVCDPQLLLFLTRGCGVDQCLSNPPRLFAGHLHFQELGFPKRWYLRVDSLQMLCVVLSDKSNLKLFF